MYIYGIHPVEEVLSRAPDRVVRLVVVGDLNDRQFDEIADLADEAGLYADHASMREINDLTDGGNHQRVAVEVDSYPYRSLRGVLDELDENSFGCIAALAQVQDPGNLGAILRSAAALDVDAVVIPKHRAAGMTPAVVRASAGLALEVPVVRVTNLARTLRELKEDGFWVVGTVADDGQPLWSLDWEMNAVVVMGGEHKGMRPGVEKECDFRVTVPLSNRAESLNVAAASSIAFYDRLRTLQE